METAIEVALISAGATVVAAAFTILPHIWKKGERQPSRHPDDAVTARDDDGRTTMPATVGKIYGLKDAAKLTGGRHDEKTRFQLKSVNGDVLTIQAHNRISDSKSGRDIERRFFTVTPEDLASPPPPNGPRTSFARVTGVSPSAQRAPRELDIAVERNEISLHIHQPNGSQSKFWVDQTALQSVLDTLDQLVSPDGVRRIEVAARSARKQTSIAFVLRDGGEVEVQADWWIWVRAEDLKAAIQTLGMRPPWSA